MIPVLPIFTSIRIAYILPQDTMTFTYLGYYAFLHLLEGMYMVKVELKNGSAHYNQFLPMYSGDQLKWQTASRIVIAGSNSFSNDIHLCQGIESSGSGSIGGYVTRKESDGSLLGNAEVILFDSTMHSVKFVVSDETGQFDFSDLGFGTYFLYPEVTGKFGLLKEIEITPASPSIQGVVLEVSDIDYTGIGPGNGEFGSPPAHVFPNPFTDEIHVQFSLLKPAGIHISIVNLTGNMVYSGRYNVNAEHSDLVIPLREIPNGIYFLMIRSDDGSILSTRKVIKH